MPRAGAPCPLRAPRSRPLWRGWLGAGAGAAGLVLATLHAAAQGTVQGTIAAPAIDYLFYPFVTNGGTRGSTLYTFGAAGNPGFDDRDAQDFFQFSTASLVTPGLSLASYQIVSVKLTLHYSGASNLLYDGTYDRYQTFGAGATLADGDAGRPVELYGAGFRNGFTSATVSESMGFSTQPVAFDGSTPVDHIRSVFATDFEHGTAINGSSRDISNNVTDAFDPTPFAIGQVTAENLVNGLVQKNSEMTFTLDLTQADILAYLQLSLQEGRLGLVTSSLQGASQGGSAAYPIFYPRENVIDFPATLELVAQVVPEPGALTTSLCGLALLAATWRGGQALRQRRSSPHE